MNQKQQIEQEAEKFAGSKYLKNHQPKTWDSRKRGFIAGANFMAGLKDEWISVEERLPKKNELVIVCNGKDNWVCAGQINDDGLWYNQWQDNYSDASIIPTHWMTLPLPPKTNP